MRIAIVLLCCAVPLLAPAHEHSCEGGKGAEAASITFFFGPEAVTLVAKPAVVTRTTWGCPDGQGSRWTPQYTTVTHLIVHHSATPNSSSDWAATVRSIWNHHAINNGWGDIGYNYLIDSNGVVYEGRAGGDNAIGAHFSCQNGNTMGVCMLGSFTNSSPTSAALNSLKQLLAWKAEQRGIDPLGSSYHSGTRLTIPNISGHRNANPSSQACSTTTCPGNNLYAQLPAIRSDVNTLIEGANPPTVQARPATLITATSARLWGRMVTNGGAAITERRLEWGPSNTWSSFTSNVTVSGSDFYYDVTGLMPTNNYQVRAWARNAAGWHSNGPVFFTTSVVRPPNDNFANRTIVAGWTVVTNGTNINATKEIGEANHAGNAGGKSVWWSWTPAVNGRVIVSTAGSSFDTLLGIYTGSSVSTLMNVASDNNSGPALTSRASFSCERGIAYRIAVDSVGGASGNIALSIVIEPTLRISKTGDKVVLSWTNAATGFTLQQASPLPGAPWVTASPLPVVVNGEHHMTNTASGAARFYRLRRTD
jgi:hypothetical protein